MNFFANRAEFVALTISSSAIWLRLSVCGLPTTNHAA
jgi:hypothetical protein